MNTATVPEYVRTNFSLIDVYPGENKRPGSEVTLCLSSLSDEKDRYRVYLSPEKAREVAAMLSRAATTIEDSHA